MPWLLSIFPLASRVGSFVYYRTRYAGPDVPRTGPALLVANHPNSLLDPMLVGAAAGRPVRFLAKAPLFHDPKTAWLVKSAGAIPVHRRSDDPTQVEKNVDAFAAVYAELGNGAAVGIFPEGLSHSEPAMAPLKTGAARMALGAVRLAGGAFPIVPLGLMFPRKDEFRSRAYVVRGVPIAWDDLAARGPDDADAVRTLTERIMAGLQTVTVNLAQWADQPLVECAVRIWEAEYAAVPTAAERVERLEQTTRLLGVLRRIEDPDGERLAGDVDRFRRRLERLRLRPRDLGEAVSAKRGVGWAAGKLHLLGPLAFALALSGLVMFYVPYRLTGTIVARVRLKQDETSTWKMLVGFAVYAVWVLLLSGLVAGVTGGRSGIALGLAALVGLPAMGMSGLIVRERWNGAWDDARRFFLLRARRSLVAQLRADRHDLGIRLDVLHQRLSATEEHE